jgi:hypothetical protein
MSKRKRGTPVAQYTEVRSLLRHVRVMDRVMEWVDNDPDARKFHRQIYGAFMDILQEEFAAHAITFAIAICELEDAFPEIARDAD